MNWNKLKKELESFLSPAISQRVTYLSSGYRYLPDKKVQCYITVDKMEVFNTQAKESMIQWYQTEQDIKNDSSLNLIISPEDIERVKKESGGKIPEDRLSVIAKKYKMTQYSKDVLTAQGNLHKSDFQKTALQYLSSSVEKSLESDDILLNVFAIMDRRVGKKRLQNMKNYMEMKHPVVRYFYELRKNG